MYTYKKAAIQITVVIAVAAVAVSIAQSISFAFVKTTLNKSQSLHGEFEKSVRKSKKRQIPVRFVVFELPSLIYGTHICNSHNVFGNDLTVSPCIFVRGYEKSTTRSRLKSIQARFSVSNTAWEAHGKSMISGSEKTFNDSFSSFTIHYEYDHIFLDEDQVSDNLDGIFNEEFTEDEYRELFYPYMTYGNRLMRMEYEHHMLDLKSRFER